MYAQHAATNISATPCLYDKTEQRKYLSKKTAVQQYEPISRRPKYTSIVVSDPSHLGSPLRPPPKRRTRASPTRTDLRDPPSKAALSGPTCNSTAACQAGLPPPAPPLPLPQSWVGRLSPCCRRCHWCDSFLLRQAGPETREVVPCGVAWAAAG